MNIKLVSLASKFLLFCNSIVVLFQQRMTDLQLQTENLRQNPQQKLQVTELRKQMKIKRQA